MARGGGTWFETVDEMQTALDTYLVHYNERRPHQGRGMTGRTPLRAFKEGIPKPEPKGEKRTTLKAATATEAELSGDYPLCTRSIAENGDAVANASMTLF